jgi:D-alanyl-D-alanine carboxypeptidase
LPKDGRTILAGLAGALALSLSAQSAAAESALVFEYETGHVLYSEDPDTPWYPASLTKMMTAYLAFEAMRDHRANPDTKVFISKHARFQPPTKLGLKEGEDLPLSQALQALMMKSANDIAVAIAETLGGDEPSFIKMMNQKAAELGMTRTHFINPHGLPAIRQVTTARDMALLSRALLRDFPEHAHLYSETEAEIAKRKIGTHNALLRTFDGGDGIKTGYTCASGYNLAASATRGDLKMVAIIFGGRTSGDRNRRAAALLEHGFRTFEWKSLHPIARIENLPRENVGGGFEPDARMLKRFRVCKGPPPEVVKKKETYKKKASK